MFLSRWCFRKKVMGILVYLSWLSPLLGASYSSPHYQVQAPDWQQAKRVAGFMEKIYRQYAQLLPFSIKKGRFQIVMKKRSYKMPAYSGVCRHPYAWVEGGVLYFNPSRSRWRSYIQLFHYGAHQFFEFYFPHIPLWLREGLAEYFEGSAVNFFTGELKTGLIRPRLIEVLRGSWSELPYLEEFVDLSPRRYYGKKEELYQGYSWLLVYYLLEKEKKVWRKIWRKIRKKEELRYSLLWGKLEKMERKLESYLKRLETQTGEGAYRRAKVAFEKKDYREAIRLFSRALIANPYHPGARFLRAKSHYLRGNYKGAFQDYKFLIDLGLDHPWPYYYCAKIYFRQGERQKAIELLERARKIAPGNVKIEDFLKKLKGSI
ncbi:MAG: tetratricopeptide repeat protein [Planctomycetota bacterium]|nr:MAG: tetratricopeptide repeat protein [Planctomycetota bacterium]